VKVSPQMIKRAAMMRVVPCCRVGIFHVVSATSIHHLKLSAIGFATCDCEAGERGIECTHRLALRWHLQPAASTASKESAECLSA
jgi:hypothetical protein